MARITLQELTGRREFLKRTGFFAAGLAMTPSLLEACASGGTTTGTTFTTAPDKLTAHLNFTSVNYNPPKVKGYIADFQKAYPNVKVDYNVVSTQLFHDKLVAILTGGGGEVPNVIYVGDDFFRQFIDARWIQPIDGFPGAAADRADYFPHTEKALTWKGKLYGLPYYSSIYVYGYNSAILSKAGITTPPANLNEVKDQALAIKKAGILEYPLIHPFKVSAGSDYDFWALLFASGGTMFDASLNTVFDTSGSAAEQLLGWLVDAMNTWKILDPACLQTTVDDIYLNIGSGHKAFACLMDLFLFYADTSKDVSMPGTTKMALMPGLQATSQGTMGWTRSYSIPTAAKDIEASWALLQFVGGQPMAGEFKNQYYAARSWFLTDALGYGYKPLDTDPQLIAAAKSWVDLDIMNKQRAAAKARENILVPWYFQWSTALQEGIQKALTKSVTPRQAMLDLKKTTEELRSTLGN